MIFIVFFSDDSFIVIHYCMRNMVDLTNTDSLVSLPFKDSQGKNLLFLTILENQDEKTVEFVRKIESQIKNFCFNKLIWF